MSVGRIYHKVADDYPLTSVWLIFVLLFTIVWMVIPR